MSKITSTQSTSISKDLILNASEIKQKNIENKLTVNKSSIATTPKISNQSKSDITGIRNSSGDPYISSWSAPVEPISVSIDFDGTNQRNNVPAFSSQLREYRSTMKRRRFEENRQKDRNYNKFLRPQIDVLGIQPDNQSHVNGPFTTTTRNYTDFTCSGKHSVSSSRNDICRLDTQSTLKTSTISSCTLKSSLKMSNSVAQLETTKLTVEGVDSENRSVSEKSYPRKLNQVKSITDTKTDASNTTVTSMEKLNVKQRNRQMEIEKLKASGYKLEMQYQRGVQYSRDTNLPAKASEIWKNSHNMNTPDYSTLTSREINLIQLSEINILTIRYKRLLALKCPKRNKKSLNVTIDDLKTQKSPASTLYQSAKDANQQKEPICQSVSDPSTDSGQTDLKSAIPLDSNLAAKSDQPEITPQSVLLIRKRYDLFQLKQIHRMEKQISQIGEKTNGYSDCLPANFSLKDTLECGMSDDDIKNYPKEKMTSKQTQRCARITRLKNTLITIKKELNSRYHGNNAGVLSIEVAKKMGNRRRNYNEYIKKHPNKITGYLINSAEQFKDASLSCPIDTATRNMEVDQSAPLGTGSYPNSIQILGNYCSSDGESSSHSTSHISISSDDSKLNIMFGSERCRPHRRPRSRSNNRLRNTHLRQKERSRSRSPRRFSRSPRRISHSRCARKSSRSSSPRRLSRSRSPIRVCCSNSPGRLANLRSTRKLSRSFSPRRLSRSRSPRRSSYSPSSKRMSPATSQINFSNIQPGTIFPQFHSTSPLRTLPEMTSNYQTQTLSNKTDDRYGDVYEYDYKSRSYRRVPASTYERQKPDPLQARNNIYINEYQSRFSRIVNGSEKRPRFESRTAHEQSPQRKVQVNSTNFYAEQSFIDDPMRGAASSYDTQPTYPQYNDYLSTITQTHTQTSQSATEKYNIYNIKTVDLSSSHLAAYVTFKTCESALAFKSLFDSDDA